MLLNEMLTKSHIQVNVEAKDWEKAIDLGGDILLQENLIEQSYIEAVKRTKMSWVHILSLHRELHFLMQDLKME